MKIKRFKVIAKVDDWLMVEDTNKQSRTKELVKDFITKTQGGKGVASIEVYERNEEGLYKCIHSTNYEPKNEIERPIGFGRW